jgi:subtilase family serine protease
MLPWYTGCLLAALLTGAAGTAEATTAAPTTPGTGQPGSAQPGSAQPGSAQPSSAQVGRAPALPPGAKVVGPAAGSMRLHITMALRPADPTGLKALATHVATPGSAQFRHFLSPGQVQARFGPPPAVSDEARTWLRSEHLATEPVLADGLLLPATGTVKQLEAAFGITIKRVRLANGRTVHVNRQAPKVPADLRGSVSAVLGLDNLHPDKATLAQGTARGASHSNTAATAPIQAAGTTAAQAAGPGPQACAAARTTRHIYTAAWLATAYGFNPLYQAGDLGQGITVALFELADYRSSDITTYNACYGISPPVHRVRVNGGTSVAASGQGTGEVTADIEVVAAMAPRSAILVYEAPASGGADSSIDNYGAIVQQDRAQVVSSSWGSCEAAAAADELLLESQIFQEMAVQGQSMLAAAGDSGSESCLPFVGEIPGTVAYSLAVGNPASQPFVTGVGGTTITSYGSPPVQSVWNQTPNGSGFPAPFNGHQSRPGQYPGNLVGTGGVSGLWWMPPWQRGFDHSGNASGTGCNAPAGTGCREVPDVSALASLGTGAHPGIAETRGYVIYGTPKTAFRNPGWQSVGGTSLATPLWAALAALADQQQPQQRLGLLSPSLYRISVQGPAAFTDVTAGNNDYLSASGSPSHHSCRYGGAAKQACYRATRGYDMATGLGSPQAAALAADLGQPQP